MYASLRSGIVKDDPELMDVWVQEVGPEQARIDLHLEGSGVQGHSTNALDFGRFVANLAEAVKETAKGIMGTKKAPAELLIEGASPGSVRVVLKAPPVDKEPRPGQPDDGQTKVDEPSSAQSDALRKIAQVLSLASETSDLETDALDASVDTLPPAARAKLMAALKHVERSSWTIDGKVEQRHIGLSDVTLSQQGASLLRTVLGRGYEKRTTERVQGTIDGLKKSLGVMWFEPYGGRPFVAAVSEEKLLMEVARFNALPDQVVIAVFDAFTILDEGAGGELRKSRALVSLTPIQSADELDVFE
ncbi:hypothetical protein BLJ79_03530 [Arthrobacter sp. UCD-GKA]|nr:hypothetical protein BLJ79_03530 [Arthrobacter sp. UCD-GKA]